jgi:hypothetical protein
MPSPHAPSVSLWLSLSLWQLHLMDNREARGSGKLRALLGWAANMHQSRSTDSHMKVRELGDAEIERKQNLWLTQKKLALVTINIHVKWVKVHATSEPSHSSPMLTHSQARRLTKAISNWNRNRYDSVLYDMRYHRPM